MFFSDSELYTEILIHHYQAPSGYCFDISCYDEIMDNPELPSYNKDIMIDNFIEIAKNDFTKFKEGPANKHLIYAMGKDFAYQKASRNYKNIDKLIEYVNERTSETGIEAIYSTPSCYMKGIYEDYVNFYPDYEWPSKSDDFFPYASSEHSYWTGFFTSRPTLKYYERQSNNLLQVAKQVASLYGNEITGKIYANQSDINVLKRAMGTMQHHDAVTGTEKQNVAEDYALSLHEGSKAVQAYMGPILLSEAGVEFPMGGNNFLCPLANISQCQLTENFGDNLVVLVYNPLTVPISKVIRFPVVATNLEVVDSSGQQLPMEFIPVNDFVKKIPGRDSNAEYDVIFKAENLPPLGYATFHLHKTNSIHHDNVIKKRNAIQKDLDDVIASVGYYQSANSDGQPSGAYIFRPNQTEKNILRQENVEVIEGSLVKELWVTTSQDWASFIQRQYASSDEIEVEWLVGPLPSVGAGTEVVMVYSSGLVSTTEEKQEFWTDSNGRQMIRRLQDTRFSYDLEDGEKIEPVTSNYYPINTGNYHISKSIGNSLLVIFFQL